MHNLQGCFCEEGAKSQSAGSGGSRRGSVVHYQHFFLVTGRRVGALNKVEQSVWTKNVIK
jgi:hypothetical protein